MRCLLALAISLALLPLAGFAQERAHLPEVDAAPPHAIAVTVYRNPEGGDGEIDPNWPQGFALISETRRVNLPAGRSRLRFTGVAESMIGVSAVVRGLPAGIVEQNRDAALLTPASLINGMLGNRVTIRRTDPNSGMVREEEAILRTGADGGVIFQTAQGIEGLRCSGLAETPLFNALPVALRDGPTFSIDTSAPAATTAEVTLTYLATGFEWTADYVLRLEPARRRLSLFAWATLANGNSANFPDARLSLVAGQLNYEHRQNQRPDAPALHLRCHPADWRTAVPWPPAAPAVGDDAEGGEDIIVTATRRSASMQNMAIALASEEALGDLQLYQTPFRTTVAPASQKQVALLNVDAIPYRLIHVAYAEEGMEDAATRATLRFANRRGTPLARSLPQGRVAIYQTADNSALPIGESFLPDAPPGRDVEVQAYESSLVTVTVNNDDERNLRRDCFAVVTNNSPHSVDVEIRFRADDYVDYRLMSANGTDLARRDGYAYATLRVPAHSQRRVRYILTANAGQRTP